MKPNGTKKYVLKFNGMRGGVENEDLSFSKLSMGVSHVNGSLKSDVGMGRGKRQISVADSEEDLPILTLNSDDVYIKDLFLYRRTLSDGTYDDRLIAHTTNNLLYSFSFMKVLNLHWKSILGINILITGIVELFFYFYTVESPRTLIKLKRNADALEA